MNCLLFHNYSALLLASGFIEVASIVRMHTVIFTVTYRLFGGSIFNNQNLKNRSKIGKSNSGQSFIFASQIQYDVKSLEVDGRRFGLGFIAFLPDPNHFIYVEKGSQYCRGIQRALTEAGDDYLQFQVVNKIIDAYDKEGAIKHYSVLSDMAYYEPSVESNSVLVIQNRNATRNIITFVNAADRNAVVRGLQNAGVHRGH